MTGGTVLITGVGGFIGWRLARTLVDAGRAVVGMDRVAPRQEHGFAFVQAELGDPHALYATLRRHGVERIVHCGGISGPMLAREAPHRVLEVNAGGTRHVLEAARVMGVSRVVFLSSIMAYGAQPSDRPVVEDAPLNACDPYGASKICGEAMLRAYAAQHGVDGASLRVAAVYGPGRTTDCVVRLMLQNALDGRPTHIPHTGETRRQYVFVDDVVRAVILALDSERLPLPAYNISGGTYLPLHEVAAVAADVVPGVQVSFGADPHPFDYPIGPFDLGASERDLGYVPRVPLRDGIAAYAEWLGHRADGRRRHGQHLK